MEEQKLYTCEDNILKCKSYERIKTILKQSDEIINNARQNDEFENIKHKIYDLIHNEYIVLSNDFYHIKHKHSTKSKSNQFDETNHCDIGTCHYIHKHCKDGSKSFTLMKRIHLYLLHYHYINNGNITVIMADESTIEPKLFELIIKEICIMQSEGIYVKTLKFKWLSTMSFENKSIANKLFIQYFNELNNWQLIYFHNCIQFDSYPMQPINDDATKHITIKKCHIHFEHILLVEGYSKNIELFIPQSIMDSILFFYAKPLIIQIKQDVESKKLVYFLYCVITDTWYSMIRQLERKTKRNSITKLYYGEKCNKKLNSKKWRSWLDVSQFIESNCFFLSDLVSEERSQGREEEWEDTVAQQYIPTDSEVIAELKNIAKCHRRMQSAIDDLAQRLPFEEETNQQVAVTMMNHINEMEYDIDLLLSTSEEDEYDNLEW